MVKISVPVRRAMNRCIRKMRDAQIRDQEFTIKLQDCAYRGKLRDEELISLYSEAWLAFDVIQKLFEEDDSSDDPEEPILVRTKPTSSRERDL